MCKRVRDDIRLAENLLGQALGLLEATAESPHLSDAERDEAAELAEGVALVYRQVVLFGP